MDEELVLEHPLIPHVDAGIAVRRTGQVGAEMERERPGKSERCRDVTGQNGEL